MMVHTDASSQSGEDYWWTKSTRISQQPRTAAMPWLST